MEAIEFFNNLKSQTRDKAIIEFRKLLMQDEIKREIDFRVIKEKIIARWSTSALEYILKRAWVETVGSGKKRTYVVGKNGAGEYGVYLISMRDFWATGLVGFSSHEEAINHLKTIVNTPSV